MNGELEQIMKILSDGYAIKILTASYKEEKSAIELSQELQVPIAACYRRLHALQTIGFMDVKEKTNSKGKKIKYYNSIIKKVSINIEANTIEIRIDDKYGNTKVYRGKIIAKGYGK